MKKAVVIFSGGQDSTTCLYWAKDHFDNVEAITFAYGQRHAIEVECAKNICIAAGVRQTIVDISFLNTIVESAMLCGGNISEINPKGLPASFVPNRNQLFITLAHAYAQKIGAENLVTGVCQTDYSGYPDCRQVFINAIEYLSNIGSYSMIKIHTPVINKTKAETFQMAKELGVLKEVVELSHTCYEGDRKTLHAWGYGCGKCGACKEREKGWIGFTSNTNFGTS